jgi:glycerol uptake facilitator protein
MHLEIFLAELIGTFILVVLGDGVVANVLLNRTKGQGGGGGGAWIVIAFGWGMAVFVAVFCVSAYSGAHINPAVTIAIALAQKSKVTWALVPTYVAAQMLGGFLGGIMVYLFYNRHFELTEDADAKLAVFCTAPNVRSNISAFFCETVATFFLVFPIFLMVNPSFALQIGGATQQNVPLGLGALGALPVGLLVFAIGMSLGGTTGYAINPARDLGPRLAHAVLPIPGKRDSDWSYAWIPVVAPIFGGIVAAVASKVVARILTS